MFDEDMVDELVELVLKELAERLRDQAAKQAEHGDDEVAEALRIVAERVEPV